MRARPRAEPCTVRSDSTWLYVPTSSARLHLLLEREPRCSFGSTSAKSGQTRSAAKMLSACRIDRHAPHSCEATRKRPGPRLAPRVLRPKTSSKAKSKPALPRLPVFVWPRGAGWACPEASLNARIEPVPSPRCNTYSSDPVLWIEIGFALSGRELAAPSGKYGQKVQASHVGDNFVVAHAV